MSRDLDFLMGLAENHNGIVTNADILASGFTRSWASARVKSGRWQRLHPGVYATFNSPPTWEQRARAALLYAGSRAALSNRSAGYLQHLVREAPDRIELLVPHSVERLAAPELIIRRTRRPLALEGAFRCTELPETALDLIAGATSEADVVAVVTAAIRNGVKPNRLLRRAARRRYLPNRALLLELASETPDGVESSLEFRYHAAVETAHGLPTATRQGWERVRDHWIRADCRYEGYGLRVELDGELAHPGRATGKDVIRDNDVLILNAERTLRFRWEHSVAPDACVSAAQVGAGITQGGWGGSVLACGPQCTAPANIAKLLGRR